MKTSMKKELKPDQKFWENKKLSEMTKSEWESLCDGCGRCCLNKLEFEDSKEIHFTNVACKLLDPSTCQCSDYKNRKKIVSDCISLDKQNIHELDYMPATCAYRLLANGKKLFDWHPLISGSPESVHKANISVQNKVVSEEFYTDDDLEDHIIDWVRAD